MFTKWKFRGLLLFPRVRLPRRLESRRGTWISASRGKFHWLIVVVLKLQRDMFHSAVATAAATEKYSLYFTTVIAGENSRFDARPPLSRKLSRVIFNDRQYKVRRVSSQRESALRVHWKRKRRRFPRSPSSLPEAERKREGESRKSFVGRSAL